MTKYIWDWFDDKSIFIDNWTKFDDEWFDIDWYDKKGYSCLEWWYNREGYDKEWYDENWFDKDWIHCQTWTEYNPDWFTKEQLW